MTTGHRNRRRGAALALALTTGLAAALSAARGAPPGDEAITVRRYSVADLPRVRPAKSGLAPAELRERLGTGYDTYTGLPGQTRVRYVRKEPLRIGGGSPRGALAAEGVDDFLTDGTIPLWRWEVPEPLRDGYWVHWGSNTYVTHAGRYHAAAVAMPEVPSGLAGSESPPARLFLFDPEKGLVWERDLRRAFAPPVRAADGGWDPDAAKDASVYAVHADPETGTTTVVLVSSREYAGRARRGGGTHVVAYDRAGRRTAHTLLEGMRPHGGYRSSDGSALRLSVSLSPPPPPGTPSGFSVLVRARDGAVVGAFSDARDRPFPEWVQLSRDGTVATAQTGGHLYLLPRAADDARPPR